MCTATVLVFGRSGTSEIVGERERARCVQQFFPSRYYSNVHPRPRDTNTIIHVSTTLNVNMSPLYAEIPVQRERHY